MASLSLSSPSSMDSSHLSEEGQKELRIKQIVGEIKALLIDTSTPIQLSNFDLEPIRSLCLELFQHRVPPPPLPPASSESPSPSPSLASATDASSLVAAKKEQADLGVSSVVAAAIPDDLRFVLWRALLGVSSKDVQSFTPTPTDFTTKETSGDGSHCLPATKSAMQRVREFLRSQTREQLCTTYSIESPENLATLDLVIEDAELVLLHYYQAHSLTRFYQEIAQVFTPFLYLYYRDCLLSEKQSHQSQSHEQSQSQSGNKENEKANRSPGLLFACLSNLVTKFIPFLKVITTTTTTTTPNAPPYISCFAQLFRLLLQYHDPELSMHFDHSRVAPEMYVLPWVTTGFAYQIPLSQLYLLWDLIFLENDPTFFAFFALAFLMTRRDFLLGCNSEAELAHLLSPKTGLRLELDSEIVALYYQAKQLKLQTPISVARKRLISAFFPSKELNVSNMHEFYRQSIVLPVTTEEIIEAFRKKPKTAQATGTARKQDAIHFIVIDCRSLASFHYARLPTAIHIGENVAFDQEKLNGMIDRFALAKGSHFVIFGTGRRLLEENNLLKVIAIKFLSSKFEHIAISHGGFKDCMPFITSKEIEIARDVEMNNKSKQQQQQKRQQQKPAQQQLQDILSSTTTFLSTDRFKNLIGAGKKAVNTAETWITSNIQNLTTADGDSQQQQRPAPGSRSDGQKPKSSAGKKPLTTEADSGLFSIGDDEDFIGDEDMRGDTDQDSIKIDDLAAKNIRVFAGKIHGTDEKRYLCVGENEIMSLRPHSNQLGYGHIQWQYPLRQLARISFRKEAKNIVTFTLKRSATSPPTDTFNETYSLEQSTVCIQLIQGHMQRLKAASSKPAERDSGATVQATGTSAPNERPNEISEILTLLPTPPSQPPEIRQPPTLAIDDSDEEDIPTYTGKGKGILVTTSTAYQPPDNIDNDEAQSPPQIPAPPMIEKESKPAPQSTTANTPEIEDSKQNPAAPNEQPQPLPAEISPPEPEDALDIDATAFAIGDEDDLAIVDE